MHCLQGFYILAAVGQIRLFQITVENAPALGNQNSCASVFTKCFFSGNLGSLTVFLTFVARFFF